MRPPSSPPAVSARAEILPGLWLDSRLALWIEEDRLLLIADLHWGYAASHRARGNLLPTWGDDEIEARLQSLIADYRPAEMIWLGDVVHAAEGGARAERFIREASVPLTLVAGNHDRRWAGSGTAALHRGRYFLHHGDRAQAVPAGAVEITGHHHPAVSCDDAAGTRLKLPAMVASPQRLILPAFSPWAAGTPWNDRLGSADRLWVIAPARVFQFRSARSAASSAS